MGFWRARVLNCLHEHSSNSNTAASLYDIYVCTCMYVCIIYPFQTVTNIHKTFTCNNFIMMMICYCCWCDVYNFAFDITLAMFASSIYNASMLLFLKHFLTLLEISRLNLWLWLKISTIEQFFPWWIRNGSKQFTKFVLLKKNFRNLLKNLFFSLTIVSVEFT